MSQNDQFLEDLAKHFPKPDPDDAMKLLTAIQSLTVSVQIAAHALDRALWGIFVLAVVCVAQMLALAFRP